MPRRFVALCAITILTTLPAHAQAPVAADSLRRLLTLVANISRRIDSLDTADVDVQRRARELMDDFAKHNAEPCEYPQGHPELCANYNAERLQLNDRSVAIQKELRAIDSPRRALRTQFAALLTQVRMASVAQVLTRQKDQIVACAMLDGVSEQAACLGRISVNGRRP